jgi:glyoxylase-like metal-dependent hydrolase (beta-lactamase superfamily II)
MSDDEYEVVIARHGTRGGARSEVFLNYALYREPEGPITTDYYLWVIRNASRTIFVDTGFAHAAARRRGRKVIHAPSDIYARIGADTTGDSPLIITHAHWDHIGNLDLFPRAPIWIARAESDFWGSEIARAPMIAHFTEPAELATLAELRSGGRLQLFDDSAEVAPGVHVIRVGGHTPGQSMVTVRTRAGTVLLTSDVVHFREELVDEKPFLSMTDLPAMYEGFHLVKQMLSDGDVDIVVTGHDAEALSDGELLDEHTAVIGRI